MLALAAVLAFLIGVVLGMLGGGGGILTVPMLVYAIGLEPKTAIASSLLVVGTTSAVSVFVHARAGTVRFKIGALFGLFSMGAAYAGGRLASLVPGTALLVLFGAVMITTATAMLRGRKENAESRPPRVPLVAVLGITVGLLSGLVGAGGGFLIVPALVLFGGLGMREAVGTSLFVITFQSLAGFAGHVQHVHLDTTLLAVVTASAVVGSVLGALGAKRVPAEALRRAFAWLVVAMGIFLFAKQLPLLVAAIVTAASLAIVAVLGRRRPAEPSAPSGSN